MRNNEDNAVVDFSLRMEHQTKEFNNDDNKDKYEKLLGDEKRLLPF